MNIASPLNNLLWTSKGLCPSEVNWDAQDPGRPERKLAEFYTRVRPDPTIEGFVVGLLGGKIIGDAKLACTSSDIVFDNVQFLYGNSSPQRHFVLKQRRLRWSRKLEGTALLLAASNAENYYHWLFDSLPRLQVLKQSGFDLAEVDWIVLDGSRNSFQLEGLKHLGISETKLQHCSKRTVIECARLIVPSMPGRLGYPPRWVIDFLRAEFWPKKVLSQHRKIYISRSLSRGRKIENESDILGVLEAMDFEIVHAEHLSFEQQVELFCEASHVVAPHGAGMSNIAFCQPGARVLELGSRLHTNDSFMTVSKSGDLEHQHWFLETAPGSNRDTRFGNMIVDPAEFRQRLAEFSR